MGIGGVGMSALAQVCLKRGYRVSGSDPGRSNLTELLVALGAQVFHEHQASNISGADVVVISTAISEDNPELKAARQAGVAIWHRSDLLAAILHAGESVGIAGTHGKTTTSAMTSIALEAAGLDPTILVGASIPQFRSNAKVGDSPLVVAECDESDGTFLKYHLNHAIVTNIEADHLEHHGSIERIEEAFFQFMRQMAGNGVLVLSADDARLRAMIPHLGRPCVTYGLFPRIADVRARNIQQGPRGTSFRVEWRGRALGDVQLQVPGLHNVSNALAVVAMCRSLEVEFDVIAASLEAYRGVQRRFEIKGTRSGVTVVDDYAHHPTEVAATLSAAASKAHPGGRIISVFQPHRYSRTQALGAEFGPAFYQADDVVITDVYGAGEKPIEGVSGRLVYDSIRRLGHPSVHFLPTRYEVEQHLMNTVRKGDMVLTLGAGDIWKVGESLLAQLPA
jgi:UDP-N-acetylmuramate--alanine ligase